MKPGRSFTGARTPRLALLTTLLALSAGCVSPKSDLKTPSPNLRLPKPSNVNTTPREMPPKPADAQQPVSIRKPPAEVLPSATGPGMALASGQSLNGNLPTAITPQVAPPRNAAVMMPSPVNGTYTANPPTGRESGTNTILMPDFAPAAKADPLPVAPPEPPKVGVPTLPAAR